MGRGTDKLYITHSEWASNDNFGASHGFQSKTALPFKRLPYNFCALSLQPFEHPVCTSTGIVFELMHIVPWLKKHGTNPVTGEKLAYNELLKLNVAKNESGEFCDPVTFKVFTDNTHIVALRTSGNVFAWDTIDRLNIKAKLWRDLVSDDEFTRADIITLQDPHNLSARDMSGFKYIQDGTSTLTDEQEAERANPLSNINQSAMGSSAKILAAKAAVMKARAARLADPNKNAALQKAGAGSGTIVRRETSANPNRKVNPYNAAQHTTGKAAASLTSTSMTPHTGAERALLTDEEFMLKPKKIKIKGYARIATNLGNLNIELHTDFAPKAVYNFVKLSQNGYYKDVKFHRNIKNFMIQGGDPTGTGRGGASYWGKNFSDEFESPLLHDARGVISMANKGKNTNSSQFFILYRPQKHLDRKHTIFGKVVGGLDILDKMETTPTTEDGKPKQDIIIKEIVVFVDPFEEFLKKRSEQEEEEKRAEEKRRQETEEDRVTWTGKRIRGDGAVEGGGGTVVGKYLKEAAAMKQDEDEIVEEIVEDEYVYEEPVKKKARSGGGFGNFDSW
ncbi:cyclophilin-like domain-containing protein [Geopyxis carbonaria]|nr:cyclophilin-like domain-containing protein [Geopyxis carbonaria]